MELPSMTLQTLKKNIKYLGILLFSYLYIQNMNLAKAYAIDSLKLWYSQLLPCQFSALILLEFWKESGLINLVNKRIGSVNCFFFHISKESSFLIPAGIFFGFPSAPKALLMGIQEGTIDPLEGNRILPFVNLFSIPFLFAYCYPLYYNTRKSGISIIWFAFFYYGIHLIGLSLWERIPKKRNQPSSHESLKVIPPKPLQTIVWNSIESTVMLAGYMLFFSTCKIILVGFPKKLTNIIIPFVEITTGISHCIRCDQLPLLFASLVFGSFSCILQTKAILGKYFHLYYYVCVKTILATITYIVCKQLSL